jgi:hypothetical protein
MHPILHRTSRFITTFAAAMVVAFTLLFAGGCAANAPTTADRDAPLSTVAERDQFRELLLKALDREALYTLVGGLKPMSTGFWRGRIDVAAPETAEVVRVRRVLAPLRNQTYYADVQTFATAHDGQRHVEAYVVHRAALAAMLRREAAFWSPLGVTPCTHPAEIVSIVDRLPRADRWRAYGLLFGYPNYAIDFFVEATERACAGGREVGPGKDREFRHVPTASAVEGQFTWAVPVGHVQRDEDRSIRERAGAILAAYRNASSRIATARDPMPVLSELNGRLGCSQDRSTVDATRPDAWQSAAHGRFAGVWSVEHVEVLAREGLSSLLSDQAAAIKETWTHTDRTNALLREQRLSIVHSLNPDGTYTHNLDWVDAPERRVEESGTWTIDSEGVIRCVNSTGEASSLPEARVLYMDDSSLIVRMDFSGPSAGQAEIIRHRRLTRVQDVPVAHPLTPSTHSLN